MQGDTGIRVKLFRFRLKAGAWSLSSFCDTTIASTPIGSAIKKWNAGFHKYDFHTTCNKNNISSSLFGTYFTSRHANVLLSFTTTNIYTCIVLSIYIFMYFSRHGSL